MYEFNDQHAPEDQVWISTTPVSHKGCIMKTA